MPPASAAHGISTYADTGLGFSFLLGTDYEKKKHKLQQELQLDYKQHVAKKKELKTSGTHPQPQGLSLPIDDNTSVQEKLREERKKEYNLFLQKQAQNKRLRRSKPVAAEAPDAACISPPASPLLIPNILSNYPSPPWERPASRRDAATLTEARDDGKRTGAWNPVHRARRRWQIVRQKEPYSSEEELNSDREEVVEFRHRRRQDRYTPEPEFKVERRTRERRAHRAPQDTKEVEAPGGYDQNNNDLFGKSDLQMPDRMRAAARSRPATSRDNAEFATGLMIGVTEERTASQLRKEQYKQELLKQIAEQQKNKKREKKQELRVAATGATDPEKESHRIKHYGVVHPLYDNWRPDISKKPGIDLDPNPQARDNKPEQNIPLGESHVDYSAALSQLTGPPVPGPGVRAAQGIPQLDFFNEDYHRDFSNMLGEVNMPRVAAVPPPVPPSVTRHYKTPYDAAYFYYGARNPLDPSLPYYQNGASEGQQHSGKYHCPPVRPSGLTEALDWHRATPQNVAKVPSEKSQQRRERALSHQEALRQQIKEREECRRREKEEKERYDAKVEAELLAYNPWGRSGGGAPIKDQNGNLTQMHRTNTESYKTPLSRNSGYTQSFLMRSVLSPGRGVACVTPPHQLSGFAENEYKEDLQKQIREKKQQQEAERERLRLEEEKEEKRLEDQRARMKRDYEEEQMKHKKKLVQTEEQSWVHEPSAAQCRKEERKAIQEQETRKKEPESNRDREERQAVLNYEREPSPPIPTLQKRQTNPVESRPPSVVSQLSSRTERYASAPSCREVPAKPPLLPGSEQEVIRELSALRRYLRNEQGQLGVQLSYTDSQSSHYPPHSRPKQRPRVDAFESTRRKAAQPATRSSPFDAAYFNMQNIREFNQLKHRDTASREELRHMYPDPPTDAQSLDIQQQALLREQRRKITIMKREEERGFLDQELNYKPRNKPGHLFHRDDALPSQSAFIDVYSGDASEEQVHQQRRQPSAESRERTAARRRRDFDVPKSMDEAADSVDQRGHQASQGTDRKLRSKGRLHDQHQTPHGHTEEPSGDEADVLSLRSALGRRVSVDTVATEPWLRPGTSDAVKHSVCRESRMDTLPRLTNRAT
ncbi:centrosome and spindle pole-associated protein 1 isoform X2 [Notolabrus celidotus]|uniref:centrosome and spindle pole-associated protein 1 isoform X2 n=1 Tax=Notolabrus celidotus TaxID=1203425 RepID=UPI0014902E2C|nr:centrosome and spindle pole-associated protein 1 isoform X2 [Notolabrus celidotus]